MTKLIFFCPGLVRARNLILLLRHFDELTNAEAARELHLQESAASKRFIPALRRLKEILASLPGDIEEFRP